MKALKFIFIINLLFIVFTSYAERKDNLDFYLIIDKSLSMDTKIDAVKDYINNTIIDKELLPGDTLTLIAFFGKTEKIFSLEKIESSNKEALKEKISKIDATGVWTDIGSALDSLQNILKNQTDTGRKKYFMLITDGKQEAPNTSKYYSPDGKFNHELLENAKTIQKQGWKIEILSIGKSSMGEDLSEELSSGFTEVDENPTEEELTEKTKDTFKDLELKGPPQLDPVPSDGKTRLKLTILSNETKDPVAITINKIRLTSGDNVQKSIISNNFVFIVPPKETTTINIPVKLDLKLDKGNQNAEISFSFTGSASFTPAVSNIKFRIKGFIESNLWWLLILAIILLALIVFLIIISINYVNSKLSFKITADGVSLNKNRFSLKHGKSLYITDSKDGFDLLNNKKDHSFGMILAFPQGLRMNPIDSKRFKDPDKLPKNILGTSFYVKKADGNLVTLKFEK